MDYHGITMKGPFIGQKVSNLPNWTSDDIGREVFDIVENKKYYSNNSGWIDPDVDKIWTYQNTAPMQQDAILLLPWMKYIIFQIKPR